jgi:hypothetical protein
MSTNPIAGTVPTRFDNMNLMDAAQMILTERGMLLDNQLKMQIEAIDKKNAQLKEANDMLARAMACKASNTNPMPTDVQAWFTKNGVSNPVGTNTDKPEKWDAVIKAIQGQADNLSSQSQMDMTRLQSLMGKNNNTWEQLSNMQNKILQNLGSIIRNI